MKRHNLPLLGKPIARPGFDPEPQKHHYAWHLLNSLLISAAALICGFTVFTAPDQKNWSQTQGQVTETKLVHVKTGKFKQIDSVNPEVHYEYSVGGKKFKSTQIKCGGTDGAAESVLEKYKNKKVTVFFDPKKPSEAVLEQGYNPTAYGQLIFLTVAASIGVIYELMKFFRKEPELGRWK